jgi:hypothetical protein
MTLEQAVEALNRERHQDYAEWEEGMITLDPMQQSVYGPDGPRGYPEHLNAFEAIAIAEKYERDKMQREAAAAFEQIEGSTPVYHLTLAEIQDLLNQCGAKVAA